MTELTNKGFYEPPYVEIIEMDIPDSILAGSNEAGNEMGFEDLVW